jgi:hypothetical protein
LFGSRFLDCACFADPGRLRPVERSAARGVGQLDVQARPAAEAREDYDTAFDIYQKARQGAQGSDLPHRALPGAVTASALHMTKGRKLLQAGDEQGRWTEFLHAAEIDPGNEAAQQEIAKVRKKHGELHAANRDQPSRGAGQAGDSTRWARRSSSSRSRTSR